jgi:predicted amidohydrolase YtcJ
VAAAGVSRRLVIRDVEIDGRRGLDCHTADGAVVEVGPRLQVAHADLLDGRGGALIPGLADHHLHLLALAAEAASVDMAGSRDWRQALRWHAGGQEWLRVVGWDDERQGALDRDCLDEVLPDRPVRVQHRSGALWVLNSRALELRSDRPPPPGAERDATGRLTGRLWRADDWLSGRTGPLPDLAPVGALLAQCGVTGVTDATPSYDDAAVAGIVTAVQRRQVPQHVQLLCERMPAPAPRVSLGPHKLVVPDHDLPDPDALAAQMRGAHDAGRAVAVHCVSRAALVLTIAALRSAGTMPGDRVEHCAVADEGAVAALAELVVTVVTQPTLVTQRGDDYLDRHAADEHADLWRCASLLDAGVPTALSSDAPYGDPDPWATVRAARDRATATGRVVGPGERVTADVALRSLTTPLAHPAGRPRRIEPGAPADLVVLDAPLADVLAAPHRDRVVATVADGEVVYSA